MLVRSYATHDGSSTSAPTPTPAQSFSANFELSGNPQTGLLRLLSPLGTVLATVSWRPDEALLKTPTQSLVYPSLGELMLAATGADVPVQALFDWLAGQNTPAPGWSVDLSQHAQGRYLARQIAPGASNPTTELRIVLDS